MNTILIDKKGCKMIAHRGVSGLEKENTCAAFVAAGVKSYYGIETGRTRDGRRKIFYFSRRQYEEHRGRGYRYRKEQCRQARSGAHARHGRKDASFGFGDSDARGLYFRLPENTIRIAVLELKNRMEEKHVAGIARKIDDMGWLEKTTFISFSAENLIVLRGLYPNVSIQFLTGEATEENFSLMKKYRFDADLCGLCVTEEYIRRLHKAGLKVNCWTIDRPEDAEALIDMGADFITTNILE